MFFSLFVSCFLAATIIPFASEVYLAGVLYMGYDPVTTVIVATAGNWLGGLTNYILGALGNIERLKKWTGFKEEKIAGFKNKITRYGYWTALFSWLPFVSDPLMIVLGIFRVNWKYVFLLSLAGKLARYIILTWIFLRF